MVFTLFHHLPRSPTSGVFSTWLYLNKTEYYQLGEDPTDCGSPWVGKGRESAPDFVSAVLSTQCGLKVLGNGKAQRGGRQGQLERGGGSPHA